MKQKQIFEISDRAALQISNSNSSLYYHVRVTLHDIGNGWTATWGNFPGMG